MNDGCYPEETCWGAATSVGCSSFNSCVHGACGYFIARVQREQGQAYKVQNAHQVPIQELHALEVLKGLTRSSTSKQVLLLQHPSQLKQNLQSQLQERGGGAPRVGWVRPGSVGGDAHFNLATARWSCLYLTWKLTCQWPDGRALLRMAAEGMGPPGTRNAPCTETRNGVDTCTAVV